MYDVIKRFVIIYLNNLSNLFIICYIVYYSSKLCIIIPFLFVSFY